MSRVVVAVVGEKGHKEKGRCRDSVGEADDDNSVQRSYELLVSLLFHALFFSLLSTSKAQEKEKTKCLCAAPPR